MNKQELIDKLTELAKDFDKSADFCAMIYDDGASAYRDCWSKLDDLIKDVKENLVENPHYIEDEDLFWEVRQQMHLHCWEYSYAGDDWGGVYIEFTATDIEYTINSDQFDILRILLEYLQETDQDLQYALWDKFKTTYHSNS